MKFFNLSLSMGTKLTIPKFCTTSYKKKMQILESRCSGSINANFGATITASQSLLKKKTTM